MKGYWSLTLNHSFLKFVQHISLHNNWVVYPKLALSKETREKDTFTYRKWKQHLFVILYFSRSKFSIFSRCQERAKFVLNQFSQIRYSLYMYWCSLYVSTKWWSTQSFSNCCPRNTGNPYQNPWQDPRWSVKISKIFVENLYL